MSSANAKEISFPLMRYDITLPLLDGRATIEGIKLKPFKTSSMVFVDSPELREGNFDLWELNLGYFLPAIEAGWELIGLPIFPKRKPVYQFIFCRNDSGIESPKDLAGKRIGTSQYRIVVDIWARGFLKHRHSVNTSEMRWIAQRKDIFPYLDPQLKIEYSEGEKNMVQRLMDGEVDAIITDISDVKLFNVLENNQNVRRLFPNYLEEDEKLYKETGNYAPMHIIIMSKKLDKEHPDLAGKVCAAFEQAKRITYNDILSDMAGFTIVNLRERMKEQVEKWGDPWKYGLRQNRDTIETFNQYNLEQGLVKGKASIKELFAESTLDT